MKNQSELTIPASSAEELQYIRKIIAESRTSFVEDGKPYIIWGLIVAIGMGITYFSALTQQNLYTGYIWIGLVIAGMCYIAYYALQKKKQIERTKSFIDRIQGAIWGACGTALGIGVFLVVGVQHSGEAPFIHPLYACFIASLILGVAYFLSGIANDLNWLRNIGFAWWIGAIAMYLWPSVHVLGLYAGMILLFQVVPGIILMRRYKRIVAQVVEA